jgi:hypothetical protein
MRHKDASRPDFRSSEPQPARKHPMRRAGPIKPAKFCAVVAGVLFTVTPSARAAETGPMTVADLQEFCTASDEGSKSACRFYIYGVVQGARLAAGVAGDKTHFCIPDDLSSPAMEMIVKVAIGQNLMLFPADRDLEASGFVGAAIQKAFPCNRRPARKAQ